MQLHMGIQHRTKETVAFMNVCWGVMMDIGSSLWANALNVLPHRERSTHLRRLIDQALAPCYRLPRLQRACPSTALDKRLLGASMRQAVVVCQDIPERNP